MTHQPIEFTSDIKVKLWDYMGDDARILAAARVADNEGIDVWNEDKDAGTFEMMMRDHHGSPFEHNAMTFYVEAPIFVSREHFRHRTGHSYNEFSTRYKRVGSEANPFTVYIPEEKNFRTQVGTPGNYQFEPLPYELANDAQHLMRSSAVASYRQYCEMLNWGVAKEVARNVLPLATMTQYVWTCNARSLMHFITLRNAPQALLEIRMVAEQAEAYFAGLFPQTYHYYVKHGKITP
jgi:thymidylate synthase (FAD)